uniref:Uncharacterized protein n=1 Tax=Anguilla anguilla TaxID=7936 RepID=A0A0E9U2M4_ANGAN
MERGVGKTLGLPDCIVHCNNTSGGIFLCPEFNISQFNR